MTGDDTAGGDPGEVVVAQSLQSLLHGMDKMIFKIRRPDQVNVLIAQVFPAGKFPDHCRQYLFHGSPVFLSGHQLSVDDLDQGMQVQQIAYQGNCIAHPSAGPEIVQVPGNEKHIRVWAEMASAAAAAASREASGWAQSHFCMAVTTAHWPTDTCLVSTLFT